MRKHGRVDANQKALVEYARACGASWQSLADVGGGCPDGLLGYHATTFLVEIKTATGALTDDQHAFIAEWRGSPVHLLRTEGDVKELLSTVKFNRRPPTKLTAQSKRRKLSE